MKLKDTQIEKVAHLILSRLKERQLVELRVSESKIIEAIVKVFHANQSAEMKIDDEARKMLEAARSKMGSVEIDERKMFLMIKKQLAKDKKFVL